MRKVVGSNLGDDNIRSLFFAETTSLKRDFEKRNWKRQTSEEKRHQRLRRGKKLFESIFFKRWRHLTEFVELTFVVELKYRL